MLFSVAIPTFNRGELLLRTLESVWQQTFRDFEVIVVDDGSTDGTCERLRGQTDRLRLMEQANSGPGAARNAAMRVARGQYVAFLDSDDIWFPWTLATFHELIERHHQPAVLSAALVEFESESELREVRQTEITEAAFEDYFSSSAEGHYVGAGMSVLRRDVLLETGGFPEDRANAEDHDLIFRLGTAAGFIQVKSPITLGWRRHAVSETRDVASTAAGVLRMVRNERGGRYPGAAARRHQRRAILTSHARPASLGCLRQGVWAAAWRVYLATLGWHIVERRWRFVLGFPPLFLMAALKPAGRTRAT